MALSKQDQEWFNNWKKTPIKKVATKKQRVEFDKILAKHNNK